MKEGDLSLPLMSIGSRQSNGDLSSAWEPLRASCLPMLMVACLLMTSGDSGVSLETSSWLKSWQMQLSRDQVGAEQQLRHSASL